jgi:hypothetical protein
MHCILLRGDTSCWELRRSVEVLAYHRKRREVSILAVISVNKLRSDEKHLYMLHRGNVQCSMVRSGRAARHPDEVKRGGDAIWWSVYKQEFEGAASSISESGGVLTRIKERNSWDSFFPAEGAAASKSITHLWPSSIPADPVIKPLHGDDDSGRGFVAPFTEWELGPFTSAGEFLITVAMKFEGATYRRLLGDEGSFTVDGPRRVLDAIEYLDLVNLKSEERPKWEQRLQPYRSFLPAKYGYDVILLDPPCEADRIAVKGMSKIVDAPYQPERDGGRRFVSASPSFQLVLEYSAEESDNKPVRPPEVVKRPVAGE